MSKFVFLKSLRELLVPLKHLIDKKAENINWNENDPAAKGYIANRPFYSETKESIIEVLPNVFYDSDSDPSFTLNEPLIEGKIYTVTWNGVVYECIARNYDGDLMLGNNAIYEYDNGIITDTGEPFAMEAEEGSTALWIYTNEKTDFTLSISYPAIQKYIKKIPSEYLPEISSVGKEGTGEGAEIFNDYNNNSASGEYAHAEGRYTIADGDYSHAEGNRTYASGYNSHAEGFDTKASGGSAHAEGWNTMASGENSHAEGYSSQAISSYSHAEGNGSIAYGISSHAEGSNDIYICRARITGSAGATTYTITNNYSSEITAGLAVNYRSGNTWAKVLSVDTSNLTITLSNTLSYSYGISNSYVYFYAAASGDYSHVEGYRTTASGEEAHAEGLETKAIGRASHAEGFVTIASGYASHAQGRYNIEDTENKYAHIVGNGTYNKSSNAHTLDWNGLGWFAGGLKIGGTGQDDANAKSVATESYVDNKIAAIPTPDVSGQIEAHNTSSTAHADIRELIDTKIAGMVDSAPETLNTLNELAAALGDDPNFATTITTQLGTLSKQISEPKNNVTFIDQVNGYHYIACMRDGNFVTYCATKSIEVVTMPTKTDYYAGDNFDPTGMTIVANIYDGTTKEITNYSYLTEALTEDITSIEIIYNEDGNIHIINIPIIVKPITDLLIDFNYVDNNDGTYTLTSWKGTLNGNPSTEIIVPDNKNILV